MRAVLIAVLICAGIGVLAWATAKPNDGRANAKAAYPKPAVDAPLAASKAQETTVLSGGCFWGIQAVFEHLKGVTSATSGYSGGAAETAHYEDVSTRRDRPRRIRQSRLRSLANLLRANPDDLFFGRPQSHRTQSPGPGLRHAIPLVDFLCERWTKGKSREAYIAQLNAAKIYAQPIVTKVVPLQAFYPAEDYHQDYLKHHPYEPYIMINDQPKLTSLKNEYPDLYRND